MESTYGDRLHGSYEDASKKLRDIVRDTVRRRGKVIIPAFAVGRTQEIVYALNQLEADGDIPPMPIYVDSPLAVNATEVFRMHPEEWDDEVRAFLAETTSGRNPVRAAQIEYVRDAVPQQAVELPDRPGDHHQRQRHGGKRAHPASPEEQHRGRLKTRSCSSAIRPRTRWGGA